MKLHFSSVLVFLVSTVQASSNPEPQKPKMEELINCQCYASKIRPKIGYHFDKETIKKLEDSSCSIQLSIGNDKKRPYTSEYTCR